MSRTRASCCQASTDHVQSTRVSLGHPPQRMATSHQALVVVESHFGNTVAVADAVAATLRMASVQTAVWMAHEADSEIPPGTAVIVLAAPTHEGGLSTPGTRKRAAGIGAKDSTDSSGIREWVCRSVGGRGATLIALGTAEATHAEGQETAAVAAAYLAGKHGFRNVETGPTFAVRGVAGPLAPGELQRARVWAGRLGSRLASGSRSKDAIVASDTRRREPDSDGL